MSVLTLTQRICLDIGGEFGIEWERLDEQETHLQDRPYNGLCSTLSIRYRVTQFPRIIFMGLLYHKKCLNTEPEIEHFSKYNISAIQGHINSEADVALCKSIVGILPITNVVAAVKLGTHLSYEEMAIVISNYSTQEASLIYRQMLKQDPIGPWALYKQELEIKEALQSYVTVTQNYLNQMERSIRDELSNDARRAVTQD